MKELLTITAVIAILGLAIWWKVFSYGECKKVGHGTLYCVMNIGTK